MGTCDQCGETVGMPYTCDRCGASLCSDHRLPESHSCGYMASATTEHTLPDPPTPDHLSPSSTGDSSQPARTNSSPGILGYLLLPFYVGYLLIAYLFNLLLTIVTNPTYLVGALLIGAVSAQFLGFIEIPLGELLVMVQSALASADTGGSPDSAGATDSTPTPDSDIATAEAEALVVESLNEERNDRGLATLDASDGLAAVGRSHSRDMYERDFYAHENPDGEQPWDRAASAGVQECEDGGQYASENIHRGETYVTQSSLGADESYFIDNSETMAEYLFTGWMASDGHRENMLMERWDYAGVGIYLEDGEFYATMMLCSD